MHMPAETARAFWITQPGAGRIQEEILSPARGDEVLVRSLYSGISRGTESLVFTGRVPKTQYEAMRAPFQVGDFPGPVKYGYINVGRIEEGPANRIGETVFCLHPHQDLYRVPGSAAVPLPPGLPPERAVLAANMETAINACWDAAPLAGDRIVILGAGVLGLLTAWLCRQIPGARVTLIDTNPARRAVSEVLGIEFAPGVVETADADLVIHASGQPEGLAEALRHAGLEATVLELSWYGDRPVTLPLGEGFHSRRLVLKSSQVGRIPAHRQTRWNYGRRLRLALELLRAPELDHLISGESIFEALPAVMAELAQGGGDALCHRIRYS
jgi:NADPH:quinone reductase-like Zn-dependent oxidoreductase